MIRPEGTQPLCAILILLLAAPSGFAQNTPLPSAPPVPQVPATPAPQAPTAAGPQLNIAVLEGNNSINSIRLLRSVAAVVEVRDSNDFPVEDATITFTLPATGPGGTFALGGKTFTTRSDARGQAIAPLIVPAGTGKFQITVTANVGDRKGETVVNQTNSDGAYVGPAIPPPAFYKKKLFWVVTGGVVAAVIVVILLTRKSSNTTVVVTPGTPVFQ